MSSMGNTALAKNLEATITELGFTDSLSWSTQSSSAPDTNVAHYPRLMYYYHPDYLGHVEYITDLDGLPPALSEVEVYQHFYYTAWGETLLEQKANRPGMNFDSPYRFNEYGGKSFDKAFDEHSARSAELDEETGLYYYGARYYTCPERHCRFGNPKVSVWLGVDPMSSERSWLTPYNFVSNNPITRIDPDGMLDIKPDEPKINIDMESCSQPVPPAFHTSGNETAIARNTSESTQFNASSITPSLSYSPVLWPSTRENQSSSDGSSSGLALSLLGAGFSVGEKGLSGSTFRLYNQKGTNFSPKLYSSGWGGGSAGRIKTYGTSKLTLGLNLAGKGLGLYNAYAINAQHSAGQIGSFQMFMEQGSNAFSTLGGVFGAAWGIGWEGGRAITNTFGYQNWKQDTWLPFRKITLGY